MDTHCDICISILRPNKFSRTVSLVGVLAVYLLYYASGGLPISAQEFLCAGAATGDGRTAPICTKVITHITYMKTYTRCLHDVPGLLGTSWLLLGASSVLPGCLLGAPWMTKCLKIVYNTLFGISRRIYYLKAILLVWVGALIGL